MLHLILLNMIISSDVLQVHKEYSEPTCNPCFALEIIFLGLATLLILETNQYLWRFPRLPSFLHTLIYFLVNSVFSWWSWDLVSAGQGQTSIPLQDARGKLQSSKWGTGVLLFPRAWDDSPNLFLL